MSDADINFYFDPVCPFAWMTSTWVRQVMAQRDYTVDWRFISLRLTNADVDYGAHFPSEYEAGHTAGLKLLRVAAKARAEHGRAVIGPLYAAFGAHIFDVEPGDTDTAGLLAGDAKAFLEPILGQAGLPGHCCIERSGWPRWGQADDFRAERPPRRPESAPKWGESGVPAVQRRATSPQCNSAFLRTRRHGGGWPRRTHRDHLCCVCFTWRLLWRGWQPVPRSDLERSVSANSRSSRGHSLERGTPLSVAPSSLMLLVARLICRARSPTR